MLGRFSYRSRLEYCSILSSFRRYRFSNCREWLEPVLSYIYSLNSMFVICSFSGFFWLLLLRRLRLFLIAPYSHYLRSASRLKGSLYYCNRKESWYRCCVREFLRSSSRRRPAS